MSLFDWLIGVIAPHNCLACGTEGQPLCARCTAGLPVMPPRCYRCYRPSPGWLVCAACRPFSCLRSVRAATAYDGHAKDLIWRLKLNGARAAAGTMADQLVALAKRTDKTIIVPVPTATGRIRQRGYDQAKLLARQLARRTRLPYLNCLARHGQTHQHGLSRQQRLAQLTGAFRVSKSGPVSGARIVLVDDVVTTGATLEAAATALLIAGAARVDAIVFACVEKPHK